MQETHISRCLAILLSNILATPLGKDGYMVIVGACHGIGASMVGSMEVAVVDPKGAKTALDGAGISTENIIGIEMGDLSKKDRDEIE
jgi:proteasome assembly chaperone (PAC2) family protein